MRVVLAVVLAVVLPLACRAGTHTYQGTETDWTTPAAWSCTTGPCGTSYPDGSTEHAVIPCAAGETLACASSDCDLGDISMTCTTPGTSPLLLASSHSLGAASLSIASEATAQIGGSGTPVQLYSSVAPTTMPVSVSGTLMLYRDASLGSAVVSVANGGALVWSGDTLCQNTPSSITVESGGSLAFDASDSAAGDLDLMIDSISIETGAVLEVKRPVGFHPSVSVSIAGAAEVTSSGALQLFQFDSSATGPVISVASGGSLHFIASTAGNVHAGLSIAGDVSFGINAYTVKQSIDVLDGGSLATDAGTVLDLEGSVNVAAGGEITVAPTTTLIVSGSVQLTGDDAVLRLKPTGASEARLQGTGGAAPSVTLSNNAVLETSAATAAAVMDDVHVSFAAGGSLKQNDAELELVDADLTFDNGGSWTSGAFSVLTGSGTPEITVKSATSITLPFSITGSTIKLTVDAVGAQVHSPAPSQAWEELVCARGVLYLPASATVSATSLSLAGGTLSTAGAVVDPADDVIQLSQGGELKSTSATMLAVSGGVSISVGAVGGMLTGAWTFDDGVSSFADTLTVHHVMPAAAAPTVLGHGSGVGSPSYRFALSLPSSYSLPASPVTVELLRLPNQGGPGAFADVVSDGSDMSGVPAGYFAECAAPVTYDPSTQTFTAVLQGTDAACYKALASPFVIPQWAIYAGAGVGGLLVIGVVVLVVRRVRDPDRDARKAIESQTASDKFQRSDAPSISSNSTAKKRRAPTRGASKSSLGSAGSADARAVPLARAGTGRSKVSLGADAVTLEPVLIDPSFGAIAGIIGALPPKQVTDLSEDIVMIVEAAGHLDAFGMWVMDAALAAGGGEAASPVFDRTADSAAALLPAVVTAFLARYLRDSFSDAISEVDRSPVNFDVDPATVREDIEGNIASLKSLAAKFLHLIHTGADQIPVALQAMARKLRQPRSVAELLIDNGIGLAVADPFNYGVMKRIPPPRTLSAMHDVGVLLSFVGRGDAIGWGDDDEHLAGFNDWVQASHKRLWLPVVERLRSGDLAQTPFQPRRWPSDVDRNLAMVRVEAEIDTKRSRVLAAMERAKAPADLIKAMRGFYAKHRDATLRTEAVNAKRAGRNFATLGSTFASPITMATLTGADLPEGSQGFYKSDASGSQGFYKSNASGSDGFYKSDAGRSEISALTLDSGHMTQASALSGDSAGSRGSASGDASASKSRSSSKSRNTAGSRASRKSTSGTSGGQRSSGARSGKGERPRSRKRSGAPRKRKTTGPRDNEKRRSGAPAPGDGSDGARPARSQSRTPKSSTSGGARTRRGTKRASSTNKLG